MSQILQNWQNITSYQEDEKDSNLNININFNFI